MSSLLPRIDRDRCTGCQRCVDICPTQALAQLQGKAALHWPERCTYCSACEDICPEAAISLPFQVVFAPSQGTPGPTSPEAGATK